MSNILMFLLVTGVFILIASLGDAHNYSHGYTMILAVIVIRLYDFARLK
jgi:hypothetical protein